MPTVEHKSDTDAFAVWVTGLPASGKSTLVAELESLLAELGCKAAVLESDALRRILTPHPAYDQAERELFYRQLAGIGSLLANRGVPVIFDATANRRAYRDEARKQIRQFMEVYVDSPLDVCISRDPKGIYQGARSGAPAAVPGLQVPYEAPENPEVVVHGDRENPREAGKRVIEALLKRKFLKLVPAMQDFEEVG